MFVANQVDKEALLSNWETILGHKKLEQLKKGKGFSFFQLIFSRITEENFAGMYSEHILSSPNIPVNRLLSALILLHHRNWSFEELESQLHFNIEIRVALGLDDLTSSPFSMRTLFNFKNRLHDYQSRTGINLFENLFNDLTQEQLKELKVKTGIQRGDTVMLNSNIASYSRLSLLVEVLHRLYLILSPADQKLYGVWFSPYLKGGEKYAYEVKSRENQSHLEQLATIYYSIFTSLQEKYGDHPTFQIFARAYQDHFKKVETQEIQAIEVRPAEELPVQELDCPIVPSSDEVAAPKKVETEGIPAIAVRPAQELNCHTLQSPDDVDATFKKKRDETYQGFSAFGVETCDPENAVNLITHLNVHPNQADDAVILAEDLDSMVEKTPDLEECHLDGGFGSVAVDAKAGEHGVVIVQTAVKGNVAKVLIEVEGDEQTGYTVTCPNPEQPAVQATKLTKAYKANFDLDKCEQCPFKDDCAAYKNKVPNKGVAVFRFNSEVPLRQQRHKAILGIPKDRRALRNGVENLMGLMHRCEKHTGKLKVRGLVNCTLYVFAMGIAINFERIFRYMNAFFYIFLPSRFMARLTTDKILITR